MLFILIFDIILLTFSEFVICSRMYRKKQLILYDFDKYSSNLIKAVLAIGIIICHLSLFSENKMPFGGHWAAIGFPIVGVFFFLSGYGLMSSYMKSRDVYLSHFFRKRLSKLILPLCLAFLCNFVCDKIQGIPFPSLDELRRQFLYSSPWLYFSWFIYSLLLLYVLYYVSFRYIKKEMLSIMILLILVLLLYWMCREWGCFPYLRYTIFTFPLGLFFKYQEKRILLLISQIHHAAILYSVLLLFSVFLLIIHKVLDNVEDPENLIGVITLYSFPVIMLLCYYIVSNLISSKALFYKMLSKLGLISYEMYLVHGIVLGHYSFSSYGIVFQMLLVFVIVIIGAYLIHKICSSILK